MKIVYLAGPYRAGHGRTVRENIRSAEAWAARWWKAGYVVFCPHLNSAFMDGEVPDARFIEGDLEIMRRMKPDVIGLLPHWAESPGTNRELDEGHRLHIWNASVEALLKQAHKLNQPGEE